MKKVITVFISKDRSSVAFIKSGMHLRLPSGSFTDENANQAAARVFGTSTGLYIHTWMQFCTITDNVNSLIVFKTIGDISVLKNITKVSVASVPVDVHPIDKWLVPFSLDANVQNSVIMMSSGGILKYD